MHIREGRDTDAVGAAAVVQRVLEEHRLPFEPDRLDADIVAPYRHYGERGGAFFVVVDGDQILGTAGLTRTGRHSGEVRKMFLLPEARGLGVGRALLDTVLDAARTRGIRRVTLTTRHRYQVAIRMYEHAGFRRVGAADHPRGDDPGVTYALELDDGSTRPAGPRRRLLVPVPA